MGENGMQAHDPPFIFAERPGLRQDTGRNPHLADVVEQDPCDQKVAVDLRV